MNRRAIIQYIHRKTVISEEQKISLIHMLYNHSNHFDSLSRLIKSLNLFSSKAYQELLSFERAEVVKTLIKGAEERVLNETLGKLIEIFFRETSSFLKVVLNEMQ